MKKKIRLPPGGAVILIALLLFVSITMVLNLVTDAVLVAPLPDTLTKAQENDAFLDAAVAVARGTQSSEPETSAPPTQQTMEEAVPDGDARTHDNLADLFSAVDSTIDICLSTDSLETVVNGIRLSCEDYGNPYAISDISYGDGESRCQSVNYAQGFERYTAIVAQTPDGTLCITASSSVDGCDTAFHTAVMKLEEHYALTVPSAAQVTPQSDDAGDAEDEQKQTPPEPEAGEHDAPIIVRG